MFLLVLRLWMGLCLVGEWIMVCIFEVGYGFGVLFLDGVCCRSASLCLDRRFVYLAKRDISVFMLKVCV